MTINLTGSTNQNKLNLTGEVFKSNSCKITQIKKYILTNYLIPLYSEQWQTINNNKMLIDKTMTQILNYYKIYKLDELLIYIELLNILKILFSKNDALIDLESKITKPYNKNSIINMVYKTTKIQILPEYEIYNSIIGKPSKPFTYNEDIINDIKIMLLNPMITYDKINDYLKEKYEI
jgi:hypothetical protein